MSVPGNRAVITGGEGDLAREIVTELIGADFVVLAPGRNELDVTCKQAVDDYFATHPPGLLICNAAITRDQPLARLTERDWDEVVAVNLRGAIQCAHAAANSMREQGGGHIVFISSYSALHPPVGQSAYATSKAALLGWVAEHAAELGKHNIRINAILPGFLETKMTAALSNERKEQVLADHALGRFNTCREVAAFIRVLHKELVHTSGQVFKLDSRRSF